MAGKWFRGEDLARCRPRQEAQRLAMLSSQRWRGGETDYDQEALNFGGLDL